MDDINRHGKTKLAIIYYDDSMMMTKCLFISASLYLAFKYRCCESKRRVNTKAIETCSTETTSFLANNQQYESRHRISLVLLFRLTFFN